MFSCMVSADDDDDDLTKLYNTRQRLRTGLTKYLAMILSMKIFQAST